jgi:subtilisin family serine protease
MRRHWAMASVAGLALFAPAAARPGAGADARGESPVVVQYGHSAALVDLLAAHPARVVRSLPQLRTIEVVPRAAGFAAAAASIPGIVSVHRAVARTPAAEPGLAFAGSGDPHQWQWTAANAHAVPQWVQRAAAKLTIAVVDTGADVTAPDLAAKAPVTHSVVAGGDARVDAVGHGTFVASLAAGSVSNGEGIAGSGGDARLMVVHASTPDGTFTDVDEAAAIVYAVDNGARIVNLSLGGPKTSPTERSAIDYAAAKGALVVASVGNDRLSGNRVEYPAALLQPVGSRGAGGRGLAVGASTSTGAPASFSNSGTYVSLAAPGVGVLGAVSAQAPAAKFKRVTLPGARAGLYGLGSGTSYAAPQVAGAAALVWAANPLLTAQEVADVLEQSATGAGAWSERLGFGVLDVGAAVQRATAAPPATAASAASVELKGRRAGTRVHLTWRGTGTASYRMTVQENSGSGRTLLAATTATRSSFAVSPGHEYRFVVDGLDASGSVVARSNPFVVRLTRR